MSISEESQTYISNVYATVPTLSQSAKYPIIQYCATYFHDPISQLCLCMRASRSGFYKWRNRCRKPHKYAKLLRVIRKYQAMCNYTAGYRKIAAYLRLKHNICISESTVYRLVKRYGLQSQCIRTKKARLINRQIAPYHNLLNRDFNAELPNQKWCIDITQLYVDGKKLYLCAIIDLYDRSIVGHCISSRENMSLVKNTLKQALKSRESPAEAPIILHSDQGLIFSTRGQRSFLRQNNVVPSMSRPGTPYDNAVIESFFSCLKCECLRLAPPLRTKEMKALIERYIVFYNCYRIHMKFRDTPAKVRGRGLALQRCFTFGGHI